MIPFVIATCRPFTDQDESTDICIGHEVYIFEAVEPVKSLEAAKLIAMDIDRTKPDHTYIVLHMQSMSDLMDGFLSQEVKQ